MLTVKGIGGGGSPEVVNGRIEEMYAYNGEIPSNTFVNLKNKIDINGSGLLLSSSDNVAAASTGTFEFIDGSDESLLISKKVTYASSKYSLYLTTAKKSGGIYKINASTKVFEMPSSAYRDLKYVDVLMINESKLLMTHAFTKIEDSYPELNIYYQLIDIDSDGKMSVNNYNGTKINYFGFGYFEESTLSFVKSIICDELTVGLLVGINALFNDDTCDTLFIKLDISDINNITISDDRSVGAVDNSGHLNSPLFFKKHGDCIVHICKHTTTSPLYSLVVAKCDDMSYKGKSIYNKKVVAASTHGSNVLIFHNGDSGSENLMVDCYDMKTLKLKSRSNFPVFSNGTKSGISVAEYVQGKCLVTAISNDGVTEIGHFLDVDNDGAVSVSEDFNLVSGVSSIGEISFLYGENPEIIQLNTDNSSSKVQKIYHFTSGNLLTTAIASEALDGTIKGLTKTDLSETQKGQVWLLDTEKGES